MSEGPLRRVLLVVCLVVLSTCRSMDPAPDDPRVNEMGGGTTMLRGADCSTGVGNNHRERPVICVENTASGIVANPDSVDVWDVSPADRKTPHTIHWMTRSGAGDLRIDFKDSGCVENLQCNGRGQCNAKTIDISDPSKRCRYGITLDGVEQDPEIIITNCC
ncbi:MAG TPA: hypothetical protein VHL59_17160 [Thermoanaerobaculia bacterium]|nr:hypothetical protein [Thermoanaerobaculia bacterium]